MIEIDAEEALDFLNEILLRLIGKEDLLVAIGEREVAAAQGRIMETKRSPRGHAWVRWAPSTAEARERKGNADRGLLWDEGDLLDSIHFLAGADILGTSETSGSLVEIGTDNLIGLFQQDGTRGPGVGPSGWHVPPRHFLGWKTGDFGLYEAMAVRWLRGDPL